MRIDEGRADQPSVASILLSGLRLYGPLDRADLAAHNADIDAMPAVGEIRVADDQVEHGTSLSESGYRSPRR